MTQERKMLLMKTLFTDTKAAKAAIEMTAEQVQAALKEKGESYTIDEIKEAGAELKAAAEELKRKAGANGELTPEILESVAGGFFDGSGIIDSLFKNGSFTVISTAPTNCKW